MRKEQTDQKGKRAAEEEDDENQERQEKKVKREETETNQETRGTARRLDTDDEDTETASKRPRLDWIEVMYHMLVPEMKKQKTQKEIKLKDLIDEAKKKFM